MSDQPRNPSGSRWEPDADAAPTAQTPVTAAEPDPAPDETRVQLRGRAVLAGTATALTLGGGLTGFVIGHATAGDEANAFQPATTFQRDGSNQGAGRGQQGPPSLRDDDGDGFGPRQGLDGGSSSGGSNSSDPGSTGTGT